MIALADIRPHVESAWSIDTTYTPELWTPENPSRGQCAVTTVYLVQRYGGVLCKGWVSDDGQPRVRHYWAVIGGTAVDWTWQQFRAPVLLDAWRVAHEGDLISNRWMQQRYVNLVGRVLR